MRRTAHQIERSLAELEEALEQRGEQAEQFRQRQLDLIDTRRQMAMEASQERHRLSTNMQLALTQPARADLGSLDVALPPHLAASMPVTDQARPPPLVEGARQPCWRTAPHRLPWTV